MPEYTWDFSVVWRNLPMLLEGLRGSLQITGLALVVGLLVGLLAAPSRMSSHPVLRLPALVYINVFRATPPLVQLFWFFYAFPILIGVRFRPFEAAVITLSLQSGAFFAEIFRAGIQSVERGQWEASRALGMSYLSMMWRVILPQAVTRMVLAFFERAIELFKTTTLVSTIAFADLLYQATVLTSQTFRPLEIYTAVAVLYFVVITAASLGVRGLEQRLGRAEA
jgi:polar amino acid transport system permease protein